MFVRITALLVAVLPITNGIIDNGILGDPYVDCGDNFIEVRFDTRNTFKGTVFVEDHLADPECRSAPVENIDSSARNASLKIGFKGCGVERRRSVDPKGIFIVASVIVAFHPEFLTKIDRVYVVQCYYMEMEKIIEKEIQVKMPPPVLQTEQVPMPVCRYEVLDGSPEGPPVFYATIGQMVYHKWTCDTETENQFCMVVHSCSVDDGNGDRVELIDSKGCAKDKYLLQNLDYVSDLMVGKEAHVYKYADRQSMFFDCEITLTIKEPNQQFCDVPMCPDPPRRRRSAEEDVEIEQLLVDMTNETKTEGADEGLAKRFTINKNRIDSEGWFSTNFHVYQSDICMSTLGLSSVALVNLFMISSSTVFLYKACRPSASK
ncbi:hypothetical protein L596_004236 [Steinernema carpocapsae]|uniref:ZP domain-containing protein n=1 Tax=Steinernema carpocapsae TaxID=34508 RepID=A0A4U8UW66_STECR|nr:hypothetical protein L596_004236 [Steinernema carpocapsae]